MTKIKDLHKTWMKDAAYRKEYDALEEEFTVMAAVARARRRAGLSQAELARRMKTTQSTVARLESGRGQPSTRTLVRFLVVFEFDLNFPQKNYGLVQNTFVIIFLGLINQAIAQSAFG
jgi:transcriptional regulator with XRE-family HTH domain